MSKVVHAEVMIGGSARGRLLHLREPLSFYGGLDIETGCVMDRKHPQLGERIAGRILLMAAGRGSSSGASVLAEAIRRGTAPAAILMRVRDPIVAVGALVAIELYPCSCPVMQVTSEADWKGLIAGDGRIAEVCGERATITVG